MVLWEWLPAEGVECSLWWMAAVAGKGARGLTQEAERSHGSCLERVELI